jgi:sugar phosphate isomerase/epimerase
MRSAVTICLVPEAVRGPFVFHESLERGCQLAAQLGFDAVEVFPNGPDDPQLARLPDLLAEHRLQLAAIGTGAGWLKHQWSLTSSDPEIRRKAIGFVEGIIDRAGPLGAPAIIGSMQGRSQPSAAREGCLERLADALRHLSRHAATAYQTTLLYEPLNRYETDLFCQLTPARRWLEESGLDGVRLLADLFHMNLEEHHPAQAILSNRAAIGHVHLADSNRQAMGRGHTDQQGIVEALRRIGYDGFLSAEVFPIPSAMVAAKQTLVAIDQWRGWLGGSGGTPAAR